MPTKSESSCSPLTVASKCFTCISIFISKSSHWEDQWDPSSNLLWSLNRAFQWHQYVSFAKLCRIPSHPSHQLTFCAGSPSVTCRRRASTSSARLVTCKCKKNYENHSGLYVHKAQIATDDVTKYNQLDGCLMIEDIEWQMSGDLGAKFRVMSRHSPTFSFSMHTSKCEATSRWIWSSTWHIFCHSGFSPHSECELCWSTCLLFQPLQISAEACQGLELEHWQVQHNPEEVSRIMQVKDASNVTLHVLDILLMPIDETVQNLQPSAFDTLK